MDADKAAERNVAARPGRHIDESPAQEGEANAAREAKTDAQRELAADAQPDIETSAERDAAPRPAAGPVDGPDARPRDGQPEPAAGRSPEILSADTEVETVKRTIAEFRRMWLPKLHAVRDEWEATLPPEAPISWTPGGAYIRESCNRSLRLDAPDVQLRHVLELLARKRVYVAPEGLFFEVQTASDIATRAVFQRLFESAISGGIKAIGVFLIERMFRNVEQAQAIKRQFRVKNIELHYTGQWEGDRRHPGAWQSEIIQDFTAEMHARNVSFYVGTHLEQISRIGRPVGQIPEVYEPDQREPSFLGLPGKVISWRIDERLAAVMREGCRRFLSGSTLAELAAWAATTELQGLTPKKQRVMDKMWWHTILRNPRFAGYQVPTNYTGYRPGVYSPKPPRRNADSELVPCLLPALWSLDDYRTILRVMQERHRAPKVRKSYRQYLLSGVAYDAACGHRMAVSQRNVSNFWMRCGQRNVDGMHSHHLRADIAERELDELLADLSFEDADLRRQIEEELEELARTERADRDRFRPDPEIGMLRQAIASLSQSNQADVVADLQRRAADLEALDAVRRDAMCEPLVNFRRALVQLEDWGGVWREAGMTAKNQMLRDAGLRVTIGRLPGQANGPAHILEIAADNPAVELALAAAFSKRVARPVSTLHGKRVVSPTNVEIRLRLRDAHVALASAANARNADGCLLLIRPTVDLIERPAGGPWLLMSEAAGRLGLTPAGLKYRIGQGWLKATTLRRGSSVRWFVRQDEIEALERMQGGARPAELPGGPWLRPEEFAARVGMTRPAVMWRIRNGKLAARQIWRGPKMKGWLIAESEVEPTRRQRALRWQKMPHELAEAA